MNISNGKINLLIEGWFEIGHSYAIVNCFQLIHLYKNYKHQINFFISEKEYYNKEWNNKRQMLYTKEYNDILLNKELFIPFNEEKDSHLINIIYRITYPYDITITNNWSKNIPICVFYTSEFSKLDLNYFKIYTPKNETITDNYIKNYLNIFKNIYFTSPSKWSSIGMQSYLNIEPPYQNNYESDRNKIISHGVDTTLFYKETTNIRNTVRKHYNINDTDILLMNIGAMTKNKGIMYILQIMNILVNKLNKKHFKLLLKGTSDLYQTKLFLESYFEELQTSNIITKQEMTYLLDNNIIFTEKTLTFKQMRLLYNAADLYVSPYIAEGFNLCCLESLACGLNVLVPETGSTEKYISDIYSNGGKDYIYYVKSNIINITEDSNMKINNIDGNHLLQQIINFENEINKNKDNTLMFEYISKEYSWNKISHELYNYFIKLIN